MNKTLNDSVVEEILSMRLPLTTEYQKCSFILPNGKFLKMYDHYEAYRFLLVEGLAPCIPDAEQLLSDLGYIRFSWIGYITLPDKAPTSDQYKSLEIALSNITRFRDVITVQIQSQPKLYMNYPLDDIPNIIRKIKLWYKTKTLLP